MEIKNLTIKEARKLLDTKQISAKELAKSCLENIEKEIKN